MHIAILTSSAVCSIADESFAETLWQLASSANIGANSIAGNNSLCGVFIEGFPYLFLYSTRFGFDPFAHLATPASFSYFIAHP